MKLIFFTLAFLSSASLCVAQTIVPSRAIRAGSVISEADLTRLNTKTAGAYDVAEAIIGKEAKVTLYPGRPIQLGQVGPPALLERNQVVKMTFRTGPLSISAEGRVLDRAGLGDRVRVMNMSSRQTVFGTVLANGTIEVGK